MRHRANPQIIFQNRERVLGHLWHVLLEVESFPQYARLLTIKHREVFVMCGTLYDFATQDLPQADETHDVPGAFWKVVIAKPKGDPLKVAAFIMNQDATTSDNFEDTQTTIKKIQDRSGFVLFPKLNTALIDSKDVAWVATWEDLE